MRTALATALALTVSLTIFGGEAKAQNRWANQYGYGNTYRAPGGHTYTPYGAGGYYNGGYYNGRSGPCDGGFGAALAATGGNYSGYYTPTKRRRLQPDVSGSDSGGSFGPRVSPGPREGGSVSTRNFETDNPTLYNQAARERARLDGDPVIQQDLANQREGRHYYGDTSVGQGLYKPTTPGMVRYGRG